MKGALDIGKGYEERYGFHVEEKPFFKAEKGLNHDVIDAISDHKNEPDWMRTFRHKSLETFLSKPLPTWGGNVLDIDFDEIFYYLKPEGKKGDSWEDVPAEIKKTFDKLGIPESEQKFLAGSGAQYESESVYHNLKKEWEEKGVIFLDTDTALKEHPEIFKKFFSTVVPPADNKFSALNSAVWSGGSFLYVPPGVHVDLPLQAYFRINAKNVGQFERTLLILDKGAHAHYVEGCFVKGTKITANPDYKNIEEIKVGERVLTHTGEYARVYHTQERSYTGNLYTVEFYGDATQKISVTEEHPFVVVPRERANERNRSWNKKWRPAKALKKGDYLAIPVDKRVESLFQKQISVPIGSGGRGFKKIVVPVSSTRAFFRLAGYYLAEGSVSSGHYVCFSFHEEERSYIEDVKSLLREVFQIEKTIETYHRKNKGTNVVVCSTALARVFVGLFGRNASERKIPEWMRWEEPVKQRELILGLFRGDGNYYCDQNRHVRKELFRISTISETLARQVRDMLLRLGVVGAINCQTKRGVGRKPMYNVCIGGEQAEFFGALVGTTVQHKLNGKKRATMFHIDENFAYLPIKKIARQKVKNIPVYNFGVDGDESYVAGGVAVHNCTAPTYSTDSLHSAVVEVIVMEGARFRYTTIQNWSSNVYNLVTKRATAYKNSIMEWVDANLGCLTADAQVFLNPAGPVSIAAVKPGDHIYSLDFEEFKPKKFRVNAVRCTGVRKTFRLTTQNFREVKATANHPFLTLQKTPYSAYPKLSWQSLENLQKGSLIAMLTALPDEGKPRIIEYTYPKKDGRGLKTHVSIPKETSEDLLWFLGLYLGDGFIERDPKSRRPRRTYLAIPPKDRARPRLLQTLKKVFEADWKQKGILVTINSAVLADFILHLGFDGTAKTKTIPSWIFSLPLRQKLSFIEGYLDSDGHVRNGSKNASIEKGQITFASANRKLLENIKLLMISCGLNPLKISTYSKKRILYKGKEKQYVTHYLTLNLKENLKRIREKTPSSPCIQFTKVRDIEPLGEEAVYDIEVDGAHNFIANGLIVHNSKLTMKYPSIYLMEPGARGDILSVAFAGKGQHQDAGGKVVHVAPHTSSHILSKSVSQHGGRSSYRGLVKVTKGCSDVKVNVCCDALIMDKESRSDTYPTMEIDEKNVDIGHEASVSKIGDEQLFYLRSRGLSESQASSMIVSGFIEPIVKELPMEYAVEMNRLIQLQMEGSVG